MNIGDFPSSRLRFACTFAGVLSLGVIVFVLLSGGQVPYKVTTGANAYSKSAIGHVALAEVLRSYGLPVVVSQFDSVTKSVRGGVLVVAEPPLSRNWRSTHAGRYFASALRAPALLVVLPKWRGVRDSILPAWIAGVYPWPLTTVKEIANVVVPDAVVAREETSAEFRSAQSLTMPTIVQQPQLLRSASLEPIVYNDTGILLGEVQHETHRIWILSDPDVLSNHGLGNGQNALFMRDVLLSLRPGEGPIVFDQRVHGFDERPNLASTLLDFPLVLMSAQVVIAVTLLVLASLQRFGAPNRAIPDRADGKTELIEATTALLRRAGHAGYALGRFRDAVTYSVARRLHVSPKMNAVRLHEVLDRLGERRGVSVNISVLSKEIDALRVRRVGPTRALAAARRLSQWKQEMLRGRSRDTKA